MRLNRWEKWTEWPLTILSVAFMVVYAWQVLAEPTGIPASIADISMNVMWAAFALLDGTVIGLSAVKAAYSLAA